MKTKLSIGQIIPTSDGGNCSVVSVRVFKAPEFKGCPFIESYVCIDKDTGLDYVCLYNRLTEQFITGFGNE